MPILQFIENSNSCSSVDELVNVFQNAICTLGFDKFVYSQMRGSFVKKSGAIHGVARSYPEDWMNHYQERKYLDHDPTYRAALSQKSVFTWEEMRRRFSLAKQEKLVMDEAEDAGLRSGTSLSIHGPYGEVLGFGFASSVQQDELNKNQLSILYALANQFHLVFTELNERVDYPNIGLSDKQREILQWSANGKSRSVIADIMNISEATVDDHFRAIFKKLDCNDRMVAVLKAINLGLIRV